VAMLPSASQSCRAGGIADSERATRLADEAWTRRKEARQTLRALDAFVGAPMLHQPASEVIEPAAAGQYERVVRAL
jgi:hypothetical protein